MDEKALLYDAIVIYLISSSATMSATVNDLAPDPRNASHVGRLNVEIDTAKLLMTQVIRWYINPSSSIRFPLLYTQT
jgi:hypothetical protein